MTTRIVFLINHAWEFRDYQRCGIQYLGDRGFKPEVWFLGNVLGSTSRTTNSPTNDLPFLVYRIFQSRAELSASIEKLTESDYVIAMLSNLPQNWFIFRDIKAQGARFGYTLLSIEPTDAARYRLASFFAARHLKTNPKSFFYAVLKMIGRKFSKSWGTNYGEEPIPDFLLVTGDWTRARSFKRYIKTVKDENIINAHNYDYNATRFSTDGQGRSLVGNQSNKYAVFLDQYIPRKNLFPLNAPEHVRTMYYCHDAEIYYRELCNFFEYYENKTGAEVVISLHPKTPKTYKNYKFGDRKVFHDSTAILARDSSCVFTHTSTSVNFPVIYAKPIIFLTSANYTLFFRWQIRLYRRLLGSSCVDISRSSPQKIRHTINTDRYHDYMERFITNCSRDNRAVWEIFSDHIDKKR